MITRIKQTLTAQIPVTLEAPGYTSLFVYDNQTCIVESFADTTLQVRLVASEQFPVLRNLETNETYKAVRREIPQRGREPKVLQAFSLELKPHSFLVLKSEE
ncbi:MAG: hypothetical protein ACOZDD_11360 [Bacteroidota bacterium]